MPKSPKRRERLEALLDDDRALDKDYTWGFDSLDEPKRYVLRYLDSASDNDDENNQTFLQFETPDEAVEDIKEHYERQSGKVFDYLYDLDRGVPVKVRIEVTAKVTVTP